MDINSVLLNLKDLTTFGLSCKARVFRIKNEAEILSYFNNNSGNKYFVLGGGSNIIISPEMANTDFLKIEILGKEIIHEEDHTALVKIGAGENWDNVVAWAVEKNLSGIEALSAIPGSAGATPVQNVGAYGAEIKDVFVSLNAYDTKENKLVVIENKDCEFSYRNSIFKGREKGRYIISSIILKLSKDAPIMPDYPAVKKYFQDLNITNPSLEEIRNAIIEIRWSKLPHPEDMGNCGSFFENPIVKKEIFDNLKNKYVDMPGYFLDGDMVKIPAGFLIENAGLKGVNFGAVGTYEKNAMVLVNYGDATYGDVLSAKNKIIETVKDKFGIELKNEPEFVE